MKLNFSFTVAKLKASSNSLIPFNTTAPVVVRCFLLSEALDCEAWSMECLHFNVVDVDTTEVVPVADVQDADIGLTV